MSREKERKERQPLEDRALKEAARLFGEELMPMLGIREKVRRIAPAEQVYLNLKDLIEDFNYEMMDGGWTHLEFESDQIRTEDLRRFRTYEAVMSQHYGVGVTTCVICSCQTNVLLSRLTEGINTYRVKILHLRKRDADRTIRRLEKKQGKRALHRSELLEILLTPLMGGEMSQKERIEKGIYLLKKERKHQDQEELVQMEAVLYTLAMKFLTMTELVEIKEMMNMTILGEMILEDGIQKGIEKVNHLNEILIQAGRLEDLKRASKDRVYQEQLILELLPNKK